MDKTFLVSLVLLPMLIFSLFMLVITGVAFVTWEWYLTFYYFEYLAIIRICCIIGWISSLILFFSTR